MNPFLKKIFTCLGAFIVLGSLAFFLWPTPKSDTFLYLIYDGSRIGEKSQVLGVADSLKDQLPADTIQIDFDLKNRDEFLTDVRMNLKPESNNKGIVVAAETESISVLKQLTPQPNLVIAHSSHQYTKEHPSLKDVADVVALPRYVVTPDILELLVSPQTTLIQTVGVPHNLSSKLIEEAYREDKDILPQAERYIGIVLGGDAETPDKKILYYTPKEATQLAAYIAPLVKEQKAHLLILNGPRTGKHDQKTGKILETSHRNGKIDPITRAFVVGLQKQGLIQDQDFTLLDFQYGKPTVYPVVLGALYATRSPIFVAGESTSMVSEIADCLPKGLVTAYTNNAMNENHVRHFKSEHAAGRIAVLENKDGKWQLLKALPSDPKVTRPASQIIAEAIKKRFAEKS